jgi:DNA transformation protein
MSELVRLRNIGPTIEKRLHEASIFTRQDLEAVGPVEAYRRICAKNPGRTIPVCYYLYSLQGALMGSQWDDLPEEVKKELRRAAGVDQGRKHGRKGSVGNLG